MRIYSYTIDHIVAISHDEACAMHVLLIVYVHVLNIIHSILVPCHHCP